MPPARVIPQSDDDAHCFPLNVALGTVYAEIINVPPGAPPPPISLSDTIRRLAILGGVDNSQNLFVSWRTAQEAASL